MLKAMVEGNNSPEALAALAKGRLCRQQSELTAALTGRVHDHHRFLLETHLEHMEFLEAHIRQFDERIEQLIQDQSPTPIAEAQSLLEAIDPTPADLPLSWQQAMYCLIPFLVWRVRVLNCC